MEVKMLINKDLYFLFALFPHVISEDEFLWIHSESDGVMSKTILHKILLNHHILRSWDLEHCTFSFQESVLALLLLREKVF